jgi:hypothetical protein
MKLRNLMTILPNATRHKQGSPVSEKWSFGSGGMPLRTGPHEQRSCGLGAGKGQAIGRGRRGK